MNQIVINYIVIEHLKLGPWRLAKNKGVLLYIVKFCIMPCSWARDNVITDIEILCIEVVYDIAAANVGLLNWYQEYSNTTITNYIKINLDVLDYKDTSGAFKLMAD